MTATAKQKSLDKAQRQLVVTLSAKQADALYALCDAHALARDIDSRKDGEWWRTLRNKFKPMPLLPLNEQ